MHTYTPHFYATVPRDTGAMISASLPVLCFVPEDFFRSQPPTRDLKDPKKENVMKHKPGTLDYQPLINLCTS